MEHRVIVFYTPGVKKTAIQLDEYTKYREFRLRRYN